MKVILHLLLTMSVLLEVGCRHAFPFRYASFEKIAGVEVLEAAPIGVRDLKTPATIPVHYSLARDSYIVKIRVDAREYAPNATVKILGGTELRVEPQNRRTMRPDRRIPCGQYDQIGDREIRMRFLCRENVDPSELTLSFDVIDAGGVRREEDLPFEIKEAGEYWLVDGL